MGVLVPFKVKLKAVESHLTDMANDSKPGPKPRVSDDEILQLFRDTDDPVLSTAEVTDRLPIKRSATYKRLASLRDLGKLEGKSVGGRNNVWWLPGAGAGRQQ